MNQVSGEFFFTQSMSKDKVYMYLFTLNVMTAG